MSGTVLYNDRLLFFSCRNLSSASQQTRQKMRECHGLVDSMVNYINSSLEVGKSEDKVSFLLDTNIELGGGYWTISNGANTLDGALV